MNTAFRRHDKQQGAIAIVLGLTLVVLFAMGGLVLDLGHLYIAKTELQNGADSSALAGAVELNQSATGIDNAQTKAIAIAQKNRYDFSTTLTITAANISFGPSPDGPWSSGASARTSPQGQTFIRVDTGSKTFATYLMGIAGIASTSTSGVAVAGRFVNDVTPIGVCAVDPANKTAQYTYPAAPAGTGLTELLEFGFRRGVTYNLFGLNPLGGSSDPYLINPVDAPPGACDASHSSANSTAPFMCTGSSAVVSSGSGKVYTNTGLSAGKIAAALNSRFDDYSSPSVCDPATAPPDTNIKEYPCKGGGSPCVASAANSPPTGWMEPGASTLPSQQSVSLSGNKPNYRLPPTFTTPVTAAQAQFAGYGVLWSYGPAYQSNGATPAKAGTAYSVADANANPMYSTAKANYFDTASYPVSPGASFPASTPPSPYNQTSGPTFQAPSAAHPGRNNRRILNVVLVDCRTAPVGPASCGSMDAVGIGKFFMTMKADFSGGARLDVEFAGLIEPVPNSEIKLYK
ncbi:MULTISPECIES: TadE/TadG family type IV pilus assembly protein [unclassified Janthinobacterium]|uniref:TadE/TadG family type IV pilus assembly protein n=1 Tax=unclassified Janthinobacterium TaxID=2610881 RepID=UPI0025B084E3|nr:MULTISPECIES: TadE/TadG family type IV pilus assembly protein [unclassified Janthinobacterium]MDN2670617.1 pilus assembly protein [Janthinobacterium sp. SUN026]MED5614110.1 TadE/TadG family type IV pilus assembly protein [Janthinobacterium sp. P210005]